MADDGEEKKCTTGDNIQPIVTVDDKGTQLVLRHTVDHKIQVGLLGPEAAELAKSTELFIHSQDANGEVRTVSSRFDSEPEMISVPAQIGPAKVNSRAYVSNWDRIFGKKPDVGKA